MVLKLSEMKAKQDMLVEDKKSGNIFTTLGATSTIKNYRSRSVGKSTHRSAAFARTGSEENATISMTKKNSSVNSISGGFIEMMKAKNHASNNDYNQVSYRYLQKTGSSEERQKVTKE